LILFCDKFLTMRRALSLIWKGVTVPFQRVFGQGLRTTWLWLYEKLARLRRGVSPPETSRVAERLFVGGQHYVHGMAIMQTLGIGATLNLCEEADDAARSVVVGRYLWLPTPDDGAPTLDQLRQGVGFIRQAVSAGQGVYIHCAQGVGRAPTMAAAYLVAEGRSVNEAMGLIRKVRPFITPTPAQMRRLEEWAVQATGVQDAGRPSAVDTA
jgi:protein-tyrosine phosphatase